MRELSESERQQANKAQTGDGRQHHVFGYTRHGSQTMYSPFGDTGPSPAVQQIIHILRTEVQAVETQDEMGDVGSIRRRRRPRNKGNAASQEGRAGKQSALATASMADSAVSVTALSTEESGSTPSLHIVSVSSPNIAERREQPPASRPEGEQTTISDRQEANVSMNEQQPTRSGFGKGFERQRPEPEYYVGEVIYHKTSGYTAAIFGYDFENIQVLYRRPSTSTSSSSSSSSSSKTATTSATAGSSAMENEVPNVSFSVTWIERDPSTGETIIRRDTHLVDMTTSSDAGTTEVVSSVELEDQIMTDVNGADNTLGIGNTGEGEEDMEQDEPTGNTDTEMNSPAASGPSTTTAAATTTTTNTSTDTTTNTTTASSTLPDISLVDPELGPLGTPEIGKVFESWYSNGKEGHYVMNKEIRKLYPTEDFDY
ncbi:hypothetical protein BGZ94_007463 [Podila epigama]|nr:hypothetical protein BGZ94_007463 [Podila epigama]